MLQNLLSLWKKKTHLVFCVFHFEQLSFFPYGCPVYVNIDQGIHKETGNFLPRLVALVIQIQIFRYVHIYSS